MTAAGSSQKTLQTHYLQRLVSRWPGWKLGSVRSNVNIRFVCRARTSGSDLDHWRGAISGLGSMHHSLETTDLQQSLYCSLSSHQHRGSNLCSASTNVTFPSVFGLVHCPQPCFRWTDDTLIHLFTSWKPSVRFKAPTAFNTSLTCCHGRAAVCCQRWQMGLG